MEKVKTDQPLHDVFASVRFAQKVPSGSRDEARRHVESAAQGLKPERTKCCWPGTSVGVAHLKRPIHVLSACGTHPSPSPSPSHLRARPVCLGGRRTLEGAHDEEDMCVVVHQGISGEVKRKAEARKGNSLGGEWGAVFEVGRNDESSIQTDEREARTDEI
ncbi:hypothetical protein LY76DRAFT_631193 [Colletotrichum caudatum]|nr:hypothetical protein LY76DRAFT_631193 [Colletotrichum caudatum]